LPVALGTQSGEHSHQRDAFERLLQQRPIAIDLGQDLPVAIAGDEQERHALLPQGGGDRFAAVASEIHIEYRGVELPGVHEADGGFDAAGDLRFGDVVSLEQIDKAACDDEFVLDDEQPHPGDARIIPPGVRVDHD